jgi:AAA ATPase-like protein
MMVAVESAYGLVGRDTVLREIRTAVEDLTDGRGRLVLITGEPGMGKSALLRVAIDLAAEAGVGAFAAHCAPEPGAPPLWCWTQLLEALRSEADLDPWLISHLLASEATTEPAVVGPDLTFRLYEAVAAALQERARGGPILLAIDDLQWAGDQSVALLGFLARRLASAAVLLFGTYRDAEAGPELRAVAARAEVQTLFGLDQAAVGDMIAQVQGTRPDPVLASAVRDRADGNPLFVRELTRLAIASGGWSFSDGTAYAVPDSIAGILRERLARLSPHGRQLLEVAALVGRESSPDVLALALDKTPDQISVEAEEAVMARVIRPVAHGEGWAFVHDLYQSVLAADLSPARRAVLHGRIGEALERVGPGTLERATAGRLAAHFLAAGDSWRDKTRTYALLAAADATRRFGHPEAVGHLELALRLSEGGDPSARLELVLQLGAARHRAGDREGAAACFREAAGVSTDPSVLARAALGLAALEVRSGTPVDDNLALLRRAVRAVEHSSDSGPSVDGLLSRLYAALARELVHADLAGPRLPANEPAQAANRAIALAERAVDGQARAAALLARHDAGWRRGSAASRLPLIADLIHAAAAVDDADLVAEGMMLRSAALLELGEPEGIAELRRFVEHAEHLGHARGHWMALSRRATLVGLAGDLERAAELAVAAFAFGREIDLPDAYACFGTTMASLVIQGRSAELQLPPDDDPVAPLIPLMRALGQPDIDHEAEVRSVPLSALMGTYDLEALVIAAPAFAHWGSEEQRRGVADALLPYAGTHAVTGGCAAYYGPVDYYLGLLAGALGEATRAQHHLSNAIDQARRLGATGWAAMAQEASRVVATDRLDARWTHEGATWQLTYAGTEVHLPDAKGLRDIAVLLAAPGQDVHVYALLGRGEPVLGADPVLDEEAKRRYRRRIEVLHEDIERADHHGDAIASRSASAELDALLRELSAAGGLGSRDRRLGDEVERARKTVSARIRDSLRRVAAIHPELGSHLEASITLGVRCIYQPAEPVAWRL